MKTVFGTDAKYGVVDPKSVPFKVVKKIVHGKEVEVKVYQAQKAPEPIPFSEICFLNSLKNSLN